MYKPLYDKTAFRRMTETAKFKVWVNKEIWGHPLPPEERVAQDLAPENLLIMAQSEGHWKLID